MLQRGNTDQRQFYEDLELFIIDLKMRHRSHFHQNSNELFLRKNLPLERLNMYSHAGAWEQEQRTTNMGTRTILVQNLIFEQYRSFAQF